MAKAVEKVVDSWKRKRWHKVIAPKLFNEMIIGETPALEPDMVQKRTLKINMMVLTNDIKKQNIDIVFEIEKVMGDTAYATIKRFEMNPQAVRRFVRRGKSRIDDSFVCLTADNMKVRIKPFMVTISKTPNSINNALRKRAREFFVRAIKGMSYDALCKEVAYYNIQKALRESLNKIYPLKMCDIRVFELCKGDVKNVIEVAGQKTQPGQPAEAAEEKPAAEQEKKPEEAVQEGSHEDPDKKTGEEG